MPDCRSYPVAPINALSKNMSFKLLSVMLPTMDAVDFNYIPANHDYMNICFQDAGDNHGIGRNNGDSFILKVRDHFQAGGPGINVYDFAVMYKFGRCPCNCFFSLILY